MKILKRTLYWLNALTFCIPICGLIITVLQNKYDISSFLYFFNIPLMVISFISSRLIVYLMPYHFRRGQEKKWYQTVLNVLLLPPLIYAQITPWIITIASIVSPNLDIMYPVVTYVRTPFDILNNGITILLNYVTGHMIITDAITGTYVLLVSYLLLFAVYVIIGRIRNNRKEQTS